MTPTLILWIYIALLILGGLMGFIKARSKASIIASVVFAIPLALCAIGIIKEPKVADGILGFLMLFFGFRYFKSKKFMPNGFMNILSFLALLGRYFVGKM